MLPAESPSYPKYPDPPQTGPYPCYTGSNPSIGGSSDPGAEKVVHHKSPWALSKCLILKKESISESGNQQVMQTYPNVLHARQFTAYTDILQKKKNTYFPIDD